MPTDLRTAVLLPGFGAPVPAPLGDGAGCPGAGGCGCAEGGCSGCGGGGGCGCAEGDCGCSGCGGCGGLAMQAPLPETDCADAPWGDPPGHLGYGAPALDLVARALERARRLAVGPLERAEACPAPVGACCRVRMGADDLGSGALMVQAEPPGLGPLGPRPLLSYNSARSGETGAFGGGVGLPQHRAVASGPRVSTPLRPALTEAYVNKDAQGYYQVPADAANALREEADGSWTETQPDGAQFRYSSAGQLRAVAVPGGGRWTVTHDGTGRVRSLADPFGRRVTVTHDVLGPARRLTDPAGRHTTLTVGGSPEVLRRLTCPDLALTTLAYDGARLAAWADALGRRATVAWEVGITERVKAV